MYLCRRLFCLHSYVWYIYFWLWTSITCMTWPLVLCLCGKHHSTHESATWSMDFNVVSLVCFVFISSAKQIRRTQQTFSFFKKKTKFRIDIEMDNDLVDQVTAHLTVKIQPIKKSSAHILLLVISKRFSLHNDDYVGWQVLFKNEFGFFSPSKLKNMEHGTKIKSLPKSLPQAEWLVLEFI